MAGTLKSDELAAVGPNFAIHTGCTCWLLQKVADKQHSANTFIGSNMG